VVVTVVSNSVDTANEGNYEIVYSATDSTGNTATLTRDVVVYGLLDTEAPVITIAGENPTLLTIGDTFTDPGAEAVDAIDGEVVVTLTSNTVDSDVVGSYEVVYSATDNAGNTATAIRTVSVAQEQLISPKASIMNLSLQTDLLLR